MILGLGVSRRPVNAALGAEMPSPIAALRHYASKVASLPKRQRRRKRVLAATR
jgi:hypothetical protein